MGISDADPITVKEFAYQGEHSPSHQNNFIPYYVEIPLPENASSVDYFGHLLSQRRELPESTHEDLKAAFTNFVRDESWKFNTELADKKIQQALDTCGYNSSDLSRRYCAGLDLLFHQDLKSSPNPNASSALPTFEEQFQYVMRNSSSLQLSNLTQKESRMNEEFKALVRARDFEIERIERECESKLGLLTGPSGGECDIGAIDRRAYELSVLNERLRQVCMNYANQIEALSERQRQEFREFVRKLWANEEIEIDEDGGKRRMISSLLSPSPSFLMGQAGGAGNIFKKSISCEERMYAKAKQAEAHQSLTSESFTIYIGAQLKTMHNARILLCKRLTDICHHNTPGDRTDNISNSFGAGGGALFHSRRLNLLMSLYGRQLSTVVIIVGRDPLCHIRNKTHFAQLCEQSVELHFESLEKQLMRIEEQVRTTNKERRMRARLSSSNNPFACDVDESSSSFYAANGEKNIGFLLPGDVYITRHSNLDAIQVVFHLVGDSMLDDIEISSRHPCIAGIRNIVRLCARFAIQHISLPLLLVEQMNERMTVNWCLGRAELVFKCVKGFLMEVCSTGSSSIVAGGGSYSPELHFNINFCLPASISAVFFQQMVDLFSGIYHLVPSLTV